MMVAMDRRLVARFGHRAIVGLAITGALLCSASVAFSQIELGVIQGVVTDEVGNPLDEVTFRIRDTGRGREFTIKSDKSGRFYRRGLPAVDYEITVEKEGYQPIHDKLRLNAGTDRRFSFKLVRAAPKGAEEFTQGVEAFGRGDHAAAAKAFEAAVEKAPDLPEARVNLAMAYLRLQRTADAVAQVEKAATLAPDMPSVLFQLGGVYVETNDLDKAAAAFEKGLAKQPDLNDALAYDATVTLGAVYFAKGRNDQAMAQFEKTLGARPNAPAPTLGLAKVYFSKGDAAKALELFRLVVASAPGTPEATEAGTFVTALSKGAPAVTVAAAASLTVLSAGAVEEAVLRLARQYTREAGPEVAPQFGTGPEIEKRLSSGDAADVLIAPAAVIERAVKSGAVVAGTEMPVARVGAGVTVRRGAPAPDVSTVDALKAALLRADSVVYNQASTGQYLETLFARMGILDQLKSRTTRYGNAAQVFEHVIAGKGNEIGFGPITEIKSFEPKGIVLVAALPEDIQNYTTYVAAVTTRAAAPDAGRAFVRYLTSAAARQVFLATGAR